jgi:type II secretory ATPase GspE/PulE/Tfp pilus assembly ATPase PilB-like protein
MVEKVQFESARKAPELDQKQMRVGAEDKGVIQEVDQVVAEAVSQEATDLHFEPQQDGMTIRIRVKDSLRLAKEIPERMKTNVTNRLKVLSGMDITKTRIPQNGYFKMTVNEKKIELYTFVLPTLYGEAMVVKVQYKQSATLRLDQLGMGAPILAAYKKSLQRRSGLYLITGPPASGKRTTVYASILEVLGPEMLAIGFDPVVKYEIPGMIQGKPDDRSEFTFADAVGAVMKQEPDVAYIGDVANEQDARATIQGAFAKRRVFARMTANDTVNAIMNLIDMGIQPFLVAASLASVLNQRLLRRLCPACRVPYEADESLQKELGLRLPPNARFFKAKGCPACENKGFVGVVSIFELFMPSEELNKLIVAKESVQAIRQRTLQERQGTLKMDGVAKALGGHCTLEDVLNAL